MDDFLGSIGPTVEVVPFADETLPHARTLGELVNWNLVVQVVLPQVPIFVRLKR
jgi:hypothetical protein